MKTTTYKLQHKGFQRLSSYLRIALVTDLHNRYVAKLIPQIKESAPDIIAVAGDLVQNSQQYDMALDFLKDAVNIASTFYSIGNHDEVEGIREEIDKSGAVLLDNTYVKHKGVLIGGLSSAHSTDGYIPKTEWLGEFQRLESFKILLCHNPEYYPRYLKETNIDLILAGHAHGGQWRIGNQGVFAPGQGFFPKLTSGVTDNRLVISRGLANTAPFPRINNPIELVLIDIDPE
ncbi:MAG: metallophosphoesterase [Ruminococcus sp.]